MATRARQKKMRETSISKKAGLGEGKNKERAETHIWRTGFRKNYTRKKKDRATADVKKKREGGKKRGVRQNVSRQSHSKKTMKLYWEKTKIRQKQRTLSDVEKREKKRSIAFRRNLQGPCKKKRTEVTNSHLVHLHRKGRPVHVVPGGGGWTGARDKL